MAPPKNREGRVNQFYNVGVQGRKTGITLEDHGIYDEHGLEPISGIFSSPEKSPPKRGGTLTASESMDIQESSIPDITTSHQILRNNRTHLPPPRSRSPKKTALGSSPRRQSSMAPRGSSIGASSPARATSHPAVARRIDFSQDESSLQETPALSGSGQRRGKRSSVYDIPEDSPVSETGGGLESFVQAEITANEGSTVINSFVEQSSIAQIADDTTNGMEDVADLAETEITPEPAKEPRKRGRKRKSDVLEPSQESSSAAKLAKRGATSAQVSETQRKGKNSVPIPAASTRRSKRVSDMTEQEPSVLEASADTTAEPVESPKADPPPKRRGRPPRAKPEAEKQEPVPPKPANNTAAKATTSGDFKKPPKPVTAKPREKPVVPRKAEAKQAEEAPRPTDEDSGKLVDVHGHPLSKKQIDQMSATSTGSRYGRGRHLSVFRELEPEAVARVGRTGRHRVAPIDFWKNDRIAYDTSGNMTSIVKYQDTEPERKAYKPSSSKRGRKRNLTMVEEEEVELDPWEEEEGVLVGNYRDYDPTTEVTLSDIIEDNIAWAPKGIQPVIVADTSFHFTKLSAAGEFFNWGLIELRADQMKRTKNSRKMHMVFNVQSGAVEVKVHENEFTVHRGGVWQVPRGNTYSIRNVGSGTARVFFAQACEMTAQGEK